MSFNNNTFSFFLGIGISLVMILWLSKQFNLNEIKQVYVNTNFKYLTYVLFLILLSFLLRAQRWKLLLLTPSKISFWIIFKSLMIGYMFNNILPARAGDIARAFELARTEKMSRVKVLATIVSEKVIDLLIMLGILTLIIITYPALPLWLKKATIISSCITSFILIFLALANNLGKIWIKHLIRLFSFYLSKRILIKITDILMSFLDGIEGIFKPSKTIYFLLLTMIIWIVETLIVYVIAIAVGLPLALGNALFVILIISIASIVPSSPGQLGTYEFAGITALSLIDITGPLTLLFIITLHLTTLGSSTSLGIICFLLRKFKFPKKLVNKK